jgi:hypothetical protein
MAYLINNYDGTPLVNVPDRTLDIVTTSVKIPGRDYRPYGEIMVENMVHMLQHFARGVAPQNPISGQLWFDTSIKQMKVYDAGVLNWLVIGSPQSGVSLPVTGSSGQIFYHTTQKQLFVWDTDENSWRLVGPLGAANNANPQTALPSNYSTWDVVQITDTDGNPRTIWRLSVEGTLIAVIAASTFNAALSGIPNPIRPGINLATTAVLNGKAAQSQLSDNSLALQGIPGTRYMRVDQNNEPDQARVRSLGSASVPYASVHADRFVGQATSAITASTAQTAINAGSANTALNANNLNGESAAYYTNASNMNAGTLNVARLPYVPVNRNGDSMTGFLTLNASPVSAFHAATKEYVDNRASFVFTYATEIYVAAFSNIVGLWDNTQNFFDVFPPAGKTMGNLVAFTAGISVIRFAGTVDGNDALRCIWQIQGDRIRVWVQNTEQSGAPAGNYLAVWN